MNKVANIDVILVKILPADLEDIKVSCEAPKPKAHPSDFCKRITATKRIAKTIFRVKIILSMLVIYSNLLLYQ